MGMWHKSSFMKKVLSLIVFFLSIACNVVAQDIIVFKNRKSVEVEIIDITKERIVYTQVGDPYGTVKRVKIRDVYQIQFEDKSAKKISLKSDSVSHGEADTLKPLFCDDFKSCEYKNGHLYFNGRIMRKKEFTFAMKECCPSTYDMYKSGSHMNTTGVVMSCVGTGLFYFGGLIALLSGNADYECEDENGDCSGSGDKQLRNTGFGVMITGVSMVCAGIPLWVSGHKRKVKAFETFDKQCGKKSKYGDEARVELGTNRHGLGLTLTF